MKLLAVLFCILSMPICLLAQEFQADHSVEWARDLDNYPGGKTALDELSKYDLSSFFRSSETQSENGVFDKGYWRIQFHIHSVSRDASNPLTYHLKGKSRLKNIITPFEGSLTITLAKHYDTAYEMNDQLYPIRIVASYRLTEDTSMKTSGVFSGSFRSDLNYLPAKPDSLSLYDEGEDGFMNNTYVGVWTSKKGQQKLCIWGLERLPFTDDWDQGAGEIYVNPKYIKNGWQSFMKHNEFVEKNGAVVQRDQWWK